MSSTNMTWLGLLNRILASGSKPTCRGYRTQETIASITHIDMTAPVLTLSRRKVGYKFMCAEAAWVLSGDNRLATIQPFAAMMEKFSDEGQFLSGAYGPKVVDQLPYILESLVQKGSRQAVLNIWRERPGPSADIPCTLSVQFLIRDNRLHLIDTMRSSDAWLGVPYDWFTFSMLGAYVCLLLHEIGVTDILPGTLTMVAGSQHLYDTGFGYTILDAENCVNRTGDIDFLYTPLDVTEFLTPDDFLTHLWKLAYGEEHSHHWLAELEGHYDHKE